MYKLVSDFTLYEYIIQSSKAGYRIVNVQRSATWPDYFWFECTYDIDLAIKKFFKRKLIFVNDAAVYRTIIGLIKTGRTIKNISYSYSIGNQSYWLIEYRGKVK